MKSQIIQIGNSQGIRIPKALLEETKISGEVELEITENGILIRNIQKPRRGWDAIFASMADQDDDEVPMPETSSGFEGSEWQW